MRFDFITDVLPERVNEIANVHGIKIVSRCAGRKPFHHDFDGDFYSVEGETVAMSRFAAAVGEAANPKEPKP